MRYQIYDLERDLASLLTTVPNAEVVGPLWEPGGERITYTLIDGQKEIRFLSTSADGTGETIPIATVETSWGVASSYDGQGKRFAYRNESSSPATLVLVHSPSFDLESEVFTAQTLP